MSLLDSYRVPFLEHLSNIKGCSDLTLKSYDMALQESMQMVDISKESDEIVVDIMAYRIHIAHQKPATIARKLSAWRSFVVYLKERDIAVKLNADDSIKIPKTLPKPLSHAHIVEALKEASIKEVMVVTLLYTLGLRISELQTLKLEDIGDDWVRVVGKGLKMRDIPLLQSAKSAIERFRSEYSPKIYLCEKDGVRLSENSLRYCVNKTFKRVGLSATPHQLRHSYATQLLSHHAPIEDVSELLGHSSMATTQIYTKLGSALKLQNYNKAHPLCRGVDDSE